MSGVGYIGSKISLISRSDIRYVGILHNINSQDSTVALEQVRSYGTEGRRNNPAEEIPPSDNVFEYIVFRGSDVKDLQVFEPPAPVPAPAPQVPNDPAILGTTAPRPPGFQNYGQPPLGYPPVNQYMMPPQGYPQQNQYWSPPPFPVQPPPQPLVPATEDVSKSVGKEAETVAPQKDQKDQVAPVKTEPRSQPAAQQSFPAQSAASGSGSRPAQVAATAAKTEVTTAAVEQLAKKVSELSVTKEYPKDNSVEDRRPSSNRLPGMGGHLVQQNFNRRGNRGNNNRRYPSNTTFSDNRNRVAIPQSDFDFESANAKFNKDEIVREVVKKTHQDHKGDNKEVLAEAVEDNHDEEYEDEEEEVVIPPAEEFYDKSKSFFDNISCEAKERSEQGNNRFSDERRTKQYQEKRLNLETFGQTSIDSGRYRGYRGRGYRSRGGGYRGGRGGSGGGGSGGGGGTGGYRGGYNSATFRPTNTRPPPNQ